MTNGKEQRTVSLNVRRFCVSDSHWSMRCWNLRIWKAVTAWWTHKNDVHRVHIATQLYIWPYYWTLLLHSWYAMGLSAFSRSRIPLLHSLLLQFPNKELDCNTLYPLMTSFSILCSEDSVCCELSDGIKISTWNFRQRTHFVSWPFKKR